jgi:hypothetical protein
MSVRWSRWWWLQIYSIPTWSADERRAAGAFAVAFLATFLLMGLAFGYFILRLQFTLNVALIGSAAFSLFFAARYVRGMASDFFPDTITKGDEAAAKRVGGKVSLPEQSPGLWWTDYGPGADYKRSGEETFTRNAIFLIALPLSCPGLIYLPPLLMSWFHVTKRTSILAAVFIMVPLSFFIGRRLTAWMWPDVVRRADENALARVNHREPTAQS